LPHSFNVGLEAKFAQEMSSESELYSSSDNVLYQWYHHGGLRAERYIFIEWDTWVDMPVREYYDSVWGADYVGSNVFHLATDPNWYWFRMQLGRLPSELSSFASGVVPLSAVMVSHRALEAVANYQKIPLGVFCELRLGTLLKFFGFKNGALPPSYQATNSYCAELIRWVPGVRGLYHPVKNPTLLHKDGLE
jgi:hypothetical protein